jgi:excinuclease ABC subunit A
MSYLQLNRTTASLSGGEAQRVRLAAQVGARLRGVLYVLDEPTIGLHQRDNGRLISLLRSLRDEGNSIVVVEHDEQTIRAADHLLDLGPGAGEGGGFKVAEGPLEAVLASPDSLTAQYLRGEKAVPVPPARRRAAGWLTIRKAREHNLKGIDVRVPLAAMTAVTGVSGSGKSTLVYDILFKALENRLHKARQRVGAHDRMEGVDGLDKVVAVDQKPIGRTPRSNPATYTGLFTALRDLMARTPEARARGYASGRFSFNVAGGRCPACEGQGVQTLEMSFLPDVKLSCDVCGGARFNPETLLVRWKERSIGEVLQMTADEAAEFFVAHPSVHHPLRLLQAVGLGYLSLGQASPTLSGGEAQRIKLVSELARAGEHPAPPRKARPVLSPVEGPAAAGEGMTASTLYVLDEPTVGLHMADVARLNDVLHRLVDAGHSVVVIEHNLDVIAEADWVLDLGPEGGEEGGRIVAQGTPEQVAAIPGSHTGLALADFLESRRPTPRQ